MDNERRRQVEFPPLQTHVKGFELAMIAVSIICIIIVLIVLLATNIGNEFRPTV
jgi:branched-subunit amino acid ABC-type transport system permease component